MEETEILHTVYANKVEGTVWSVLTGSSLQSGDVKRMLIDAELIETIEMEAQIFTGSAALVAARKTQMKIDGNGQFAGYRIYMNSGASWIVDEILHSQLVKLKSEL